MTLSTSFVRWGGRLTLLLAPVVLVAFVGVACGDDGEAVDGGPAETPGPTGLPQSDEEGIADDFAGSTPPSLTVTAGAASLEGGLGSFCFNRLCVDAIGPITPADAITAGGGTLSAVLSSEVVAEVFVSASHSSELRSQEICTPADGVEPTGPICEDGRELLAWTGGGGEAILLPASAGDGMIDVDLSTLGPGSYVVSLFVRFEAGGDASYSVLLEVDSPE